MKTTIILILSFLLLSSSINAEEKKGAITEPIKNSEMKVLEERIKALSEPASKLGQRNEWFIVSAAGLGTLIGAVLGAWFSWFLTKKAAHNILTDNIIADSLKFVFKMRDIIDNIYIDKETHLKLKEIDSEEAEKFHPSIFREYDEEMKEGFFIELNFYSYQLRRLNNQEIWKKFSSVVDAQNKLLDKLFKDDLPDDIKDELSQGRELVKEFTSYCIKISKV